MKYKGKFAQNEALASHKQRGVEVVHFQCATWPQLQSMENLHCVSHSIYALHYVYTLHYVHFLSSGHQALAQHQQLLELTTHYPRIHATSRKRQQLLAMQQ